MLRPWTADDQALDHALTRNAALAVRLRKTIALLHLAASDHPRTVSWRTCAHEDCCRVLDVLADLPGGVDGR